MIELADVARSNGFTDSSDAPMQAKAQAQGWITEPTVFNHTWTQELANIATANGYVQLIDCIPTAAPTFNLVLVQNKHSMPALCTCMRKGCYLRTKCQSKSSRRCQSPPWTSHLPAPKRANRRHTPSSLLKQNSYLQHGQYLYPGYVSPNG